VRGQQMKLGQGRTPQHMNTSQSWLCGHALVAFKATASPKSQLYADRGAGGVRWKVLEIQAFEGVPVCETVYAGAGRESTAWVRFQHNSSKISAQDL